MTDAFSFYRHVDVPTAVAILAAIPPETLDAALRTIAPAPWRALAPPGLRRLSDDELRATLHELMLLNLTDVDDDELDALLSERAARRRAEEEFERADLARRRALGVSVDDAP
jgi:hypothetical protein